MNIRCVTIGFMTVVTIINQACADTGKAQHSWKYLVKKTIKEKDNISGKKESHTDRALVYYGAGAEQAGGQIKSRPSVVYIDKNGRRLSKPTHYRQYILPELHSKKYKMRKELPDGLGSEPNKAIMVDMLAENYPVLPFKPDQQLTKDLKWNHKLYICFGMPLTKLWFPAEIKNRASGYEKYKGRRSLVIDYEVSAALNTVDYPERFEEAKKLGIKGQYHMNGSGTAYFDTEEGIIVEKEQTISWSIFGEKLSRLEGGGIAWAPTVDQKTTVDISVSLVTNEQPATTSQEIVYTEERPSSNHRGIVYIVIAAGIAALITVILVIRKKKSASSG